MVDDGEGDDLSGFLLGLASSRAALGGSWVLDFTTDGIAPAGNPYLPPLVAFYNKQEKSEDTFYSLKNRRG